MVAMRRRGARAVLAMALVLSGLALLAHVPPRATAAASASAQSACAQQEATVAQLIGQERAATQGGSEGLPVDEIIATLRTCWAEYQSQMPAAEKNCDLFKQLAPFVFGWSRQVSLLGLEEQFAAEQAQVIPWAVRGLVNCFDEAFDKCVDQKDPAQADEMRRFERQLALLGAADQIDTSKYEKCLRFEVAFETALEHVNNGSGSTLRLQIRTVVPVQGRYDGSVSVVERPLEAVALTPFRSPGCTLSENIFEPGAPFRVLSLAVDRAEPTDAMPAPPVRDFTLSLDRGNTHERYSYDCPRPRRADGSFDVCGTPSFGNVTVSEVGPVCRVTSETMGEGSLYAGFFDLLHEDERSAGGYTIRGWTIVGSGGVLARKVYQRSRPGPSDLTTLSENTTLELRHTPVR